MGLLAPFFRWQAEWQAGATSPHISPYLPISPHIWQAEWQAGALGGEGDRTAAAAQLDAEAGSAPVVIYTYGWSPFSSEAVALLDGTGCEYTQVQLGAEWFLLGGVASSVRAELLQRHGVSSLPHVFIGGRSVGGLYSGNAQGEVGLVQLKKEGRLDGLLREAGALRASDS